MNFPEPSGPKGYPGRLKRLPELFEGSLKNILGKTLLTVGVDKPPWQEGFFDHVIRSEASHRDKEDYIRQNPVKAGLSEQADGWPYRGRIVVL